MVATLLGRFVASIEGAYEVSKTAHIGTADNFRIFTE